MFNIDEIRELIKMVDQSSLQRFELEQESTKLVMVKNELPLPKQELSPTEPCTKGNIRRPVVFESKEKAAETALEAPQDSSLHKILSPVVGTFYAASEPGAEPFVKVGQKVTASTVVGIVEVMKLFNEVEAETDGEIVEILVKDGDFVEYGQSLFLIKPE